MERRFGMKKVRRLHFWVGIIVSIFLLIESVTGIYLYFQEQGRGERQFPPQQGMMNEQQESTTEGNTAAQNGSTTVPNKPFRQGNGEFGENRSINSLSMNIRSLHNGIVGLIAAIGMLILSITGIILAIIIARANKKRKQKTVPSVER